ncbi:sensor histidine kinase [Paenibacillus kobensis]|uniref:sensor histidine kinase n=1 Tax=Paenibacillus kobensis TaxID=59841 RepID=UPI0013E2AB15|nr:HAMP domain-containing sensor histidine kinase [Paenibacillus kobensis]
MSHIRSPILFLCAVVMFLLAFPHITVAEKAAPAEIAIQEWEIQWFNDKTQPERFETPSLSEPWLKANLRKPSNRIPDGYNGVWIHVAIPPILGLQSPGMLINRLYGTGISVYHEGDLLYRSDRDFSFDRYMLLLPLTLRSEPTDLYIRITSLDRAGLNSSVRIGNFDELSRANIIQELPSLLLGCSIAFMALIMLLISGYLNIQQRKAWISLSLLALAASIMIVTFSTFPFMYFKAYGKLLQFLFDLSMLVVFPALHSYAATIFEGKLTVYRKFGHWFIVYCVFCFFILLTYNLAGASFFVYYKLFTFTLLAPLLLVHLALVLGHSVAQSIRGNKNSLILALGFLGFTIMFAADICIIYTDESQPLPYLWKFGIVLLLVAFVIALARRISADHRRIIAYAQELEQFNRQLQRTEKLKFISEIAASIAHEVRNPLQVTRGFLQFISGKSDERSQSHFSIAIDELDRASMIITDFLTFAKPELDTSITELDIQQEMAVIETIMSPLAAMHGTVLQVQSSGGLYVLGNPSKFKQAFMNVVKNSIESIHKKEDGLVSICACEENGMAVIRITDNGEGMSGEQIARLGEPYYSTKETGTGLGLMVTFRIIEVMQGTLEFRSEKGQGTEAVVRFPLVHQS